MIFVISENNDSSTNIVLDWLSHKQQKFIRVNDTDKFELNQIEFGNDFENIILINSKIEVNFSNIYVYWHRRGTLNVKFTIYDKEIFSQEFEGLRNYLSSEYKAINKFVFDNLYNKKGVGNIDDNYTNKLSNLIIAKKCGLLVPETFILNSKKDLELLLNKENLVTKGIQTGWFHNNGKEYSLYTSSVKCNDVLDLQEKFEFSLFQKKLDKKYELRVFYFNGKMFTTAIFSQNDSQTETDFRHYNNIKPNRTPPFILPEVLEKKIIKFMQIKAMKTGSIDIVVTKGNEYIFLEVNPFGQFGQVSSPGNFFIEKFIAEYLIENNYEE